MQNRDFGQEYVDVFACMPRFRSPLHFADCGWARVRLHQPCLLQRSVLLVKHIFQKCPSPKSLAAFVAVRKTLAQSSQAKHLEDGRPRSTTSPWSIFATITVLTCLWRYVCHARSHLQGHVCCVLPPLFLCSRLLSLFVCTVAWLMLHAQMGVIGLTDLTGNALT